MLKMRLNGESIHEDGKDDETISIAQQNNENGSLYLNFKRNGYFEKWMKKECGKNQMD